MGRFDVDNLLSELGVPRKAKPEAPSAPVDEKQESPVHPEPLEKDTPIPDAADSAPSPAGPTPSDQTTAAKAPPANATTDSPKPPKQFEADEALGLLWGPKSDAQAPAAASAQDLAKILCERKVITPAQLNTLQTNLRQSPGRAIIDALIDMGADEVRVQEIVAQLHDLPFERIGLQDGFHSGLYNRLGSATCEEHQILPLRREDGCIYLGIVNPANVFVLDEVRRKLGHIPIRQVLVTSSDLVAAMEQHAETDTDEVAVDEILADIDESDVEVVERDDEDVDFAQQAGESPVIRYVNYIIQTALKEGASDIHIEPSERKLNVRFRIDGILFEYLSPPHKMHAAIISRLKIMANLDISERRLPQDGRIRAVVGGRKLDLRISTLPTVGGEKCVIRILDGRSIAVGLDQLGLDETALHIWQRQIKQPHGIILVTGPTGSGKTTTLYSSLREMDTKKLNISTVEDPVEYHLDGVTQVQIHDKIGMSFAAALRSLLRQDPDVVMVGEIRDTDTARIAIQASLTGHLVLSTLHTNDAPSSITRMINIGVEPFLLGAAISSVLAQRLVRKICPNCITQEAPSDDIAEFLTAQGLDAAQISTGAGCDKCRQTGYQGRLGLYELLVLDDVTRDSIARSPNVTEFRRMCVERGMVTLRQDGLQKVAAGMTTIEEVLRVTEATI